MKPVHRGRHTQIFGGPNLRPTTDVLQATAYKPQHWDWAQTEITSPISTLRSVIDYYNKRGLTVNLCMLDISKAFDKVNHYCMFIKLTNRSVLVVLLKVLINWYDKCAVFVRWNNVLSKCFYLMCSVRQGGVLSHPLFSVYVNDMIQKPCDEPWMLCW